MHTPVVVADKMDWLSEEQWQTQRRNRLKIISGWVDDWQSLGHNRYRQHDSPEEFSAYGRDFKKWEGHKRWVNRNKTYVNVEYNNLSVFNYP